MADALKNTDPAGLTSTGKYVGDLESNQFQDTQNLPMQEAMSGPSTGMTEGAAMSYGGATGDIEAVTQKTQGTTATSTLGGSTGLGGGGTRSTGGGSTIRFAFVATECGQRQTPDEISTSLPVTIAPNSSIDSVASSAGPTTLVTATPNGFTVNNRPVYAHVYLLQVVDGLGVSRAPTMPYIGTTSADGVLLVTSGQFETWDALTNFSRTVGPSSWTFRFVFSTSPSPGDPVPPGQGQGAVDITVGNASYLMQSTKNGTIVIPVCFKVKAKDPEDEVVPSVDGPAYWLVPIEPDQVLSGILSKETYGLWPDNVANLTTFYKCTGSVDSPDVILRVSDGPCSDCTTDKVFDISYGDDLGSGSRDTSGRDNLTGPNAVYGQYRGLFLPTATSETKLDISGSSVDYFYAINVKQELFRNALDKGTLELNLAHLSGSQYLAGGGVASEYTGSTVTLSGDGRYTRLIESSKILDPAYYVGSSPVYYVISGSLEQGAYQPTAPVIYGLFHPHIGTVLLSGTMLDASASFGTVRIPDAKGDNPAKLLLSISGAALMTDDSGDALGFKGRSIEYEHNMLLFLQVKHNQLNLSNNPTYREDELGTVLREFRNNPKVYITTIGLYNANKELVAVGKLSRPILRTGVDRSFFKVRLKQ